MADNCPIIGIAGGIGSGKSAVAGILRELGCVVTDSDADGRAALRDPSIRDELVSWWGESILDASGEVDRAAVAAIVFRDADQRARLQALTHPWIEARRMEEWSAAPDSTLAFVIDAPLLFEAGLDEHCDAVIFVEVSRAIRLSRVQATRGWDEGEFRRREDSQLPLDEKRNRADYVVTNEGRLDDLREQVQKALREILISCRS